MGLKYRRWVRENLLREEPGPILSESVLQRIWFEQLVRNPLVTLTGEKIRLHHPGLWNHRAGPDFLGASFSSGDDRIGTGDVELHRHPSDWDAHAHSANPAYQNVLLHVFWQADPSWRGSPSPAIRQIALEHQLSAPLTDLVSLFTSAPEEILAGEKPGACHPQLLSLAPETLREILEEAGWHRLRLRRSLARTRLASQGLDQAVWVALAEGLGFTENREPFAALARAVPVRRLGGMPDPVDRAALLYGTAGLLPDPTRSPLVPEASPEVRQIWDRWWRFRGEPGALVLPPGSWKLGATRPVNSPHRRLAALVSLSDRGVWSRLRDAVRAGEAGCFLAVLRSVSDPFWDRHASWEGRRLSASSRLIGADRAAALLFQVVAPLAEVAETELQSRMETWPAGGDAGLLRSASVRLLGVPCPPPDVRSHLAREGLLQLYRDFCRGRPCPDCSLPGFLRSRDPRGIATAGPRPKAATPSRPAPVAGPPAPPSVP